MDACEQLLSILLVRGEFKFTSAKSSLVFLVVIVFIIKYSINKTATNINKSVIVTDAI